MRHIAAIITLALFSIARTTWAADPTGLSLTQPMADPPMATLDADRHHDEAARLTLYWENDGSPTKLWDHQDRHYTAGAGASLSWRALWVDELLAKMPSINDEFGGKHVDYAMGFVGTLDIYTPENLAAFAPLHTDRPYAGWLYGGLFFQRAHREGDERGTADFYLGLPQIFTPSKYTPFESLEIDLGIMGQSSLAQNAQEMIHQAFGYQFPNGWINQIHDEPEFSLKYNRRWRSPLFTLTEEGLVADILPEVGMTAGSLMDDVRAGATFRLGYHVPDDFGPGELSNPADFTWQPACTCGNILDHFWENQSIYIFARPYGRLVAHNALLQGDNWRHDDPVTVTPEPAVAAVQFGLSYRFLKYFELSYSHTEETAEFHGQRGWDSWGSLQLACFVSW